MDSKALINCAEVIDESICTVIILRYKVYRNDSGKIFGKLLVLKHKVESFLKEVFDEEILFQNPALRRTKQGLLELIQGLTYLCSGITPAGEVLTIPELPLQDIASNESSFEMKFIKGISPSDLWLCYVDDGEFSHLLQRLREKYDKDELQPFIFYPRIGEHVYFRQGSNIFRGIVLEYVIPDDCKEEDKEEVDVDIKVLNVDNSDVVVLPQNCFFQLDKDGTELPMQCVRCSLKEVDQSSPSDLSMNSLQKHKLNVVFHGKKTAVENSPIGAQLVDITICTDENGAYITRNSPDVFLSGYNEMNSDQILSCNSCQTSANPEDVSESDSDVSLLKQDAHSPTKPEVSANDSTSKKSKAENYCDKSSHKSNDIDDVVSSVSDLSIDSDVLKVLKASESKDGRDKSFNTRDVKLTKFDKARVTANPAPERKDSSLSNDLPPASIRMKLPQNASVPSSSPGYHYSPGPPFHSAPMHFSTPYMPFPAAQHINPPAPFHFPQYPYGPYIPQTAPPLPPQPPGTHSQAYFMPPSSSAYQSYVQPVAPIMASYFPSQPPYPPQFYPAPPSQLPPSWSQMQPSYRVSSPSPVSVVSVAVNKTDAVSANSNSNINKPK